MPSKKHSGPIFAHKTATDLSEKLKISSERFVSRAGHHAKRVALQCNKQLASGGKNKAEDSNHLLDPLDLNQLSDSYVARVASETIEKTDRVR
jgi:hypothetical protein